VTLFDVGRKICLLMSLSVLPGDESPSQNPPRSFPYLVNGYLIWTCYQNGGFHLRCCCTKLEGTSDILGIRIHRRWKQLG
jgi:hypothetical protein